MKLLLFVCLALISLVAVSDEAVVTLTSSNFDDFITQNERVLVEFYAPWCGHCKQLAPEYEKAAQQLADDAAITKLAKVDATEEKDLASKYGIQGFPTLKYFTTDVDAPAEYGGGRQQDTIVSWIKKREMPAVTQLESGESAKDFTTKDKVVLIGYFSAGGDEEKALKSVADKLRDEVVTGHVSDESAAKDADAQFPSLVIYTNFGSDGETTKVVFDGDVTSEEEISNFVSAERFPLIGQIGGDNYQAYMDRGLPLGWIPQAGEDEEGKAKMIEILTPYAAQLKGKVSFVWIDKTQYAQYVESLGLKEGSMMIISSDDSSKYKLSASLDEADELKKFFDGYEAGTLEKFMKSEEVPESNDESVFVLVGKNFEEVVGQKKDVFVEFYAPWCGHCKKLAPEYEKVGDAFKDVDDVVIAKIDATENDTPEQIEGFPTLVYYPRGTMVGVKYDGDRTAGAIVEWIKDKSEADTSGVEHDEL